MMMESGRCGREDHQGETDRASAESHRGKHGGIVAHFIYEIADRIHFSPDAPVISPHIMDGDHRRVKCTPSAWEFNRFPIHGAQKKAS